MARKTAPSDLAKKPVPNPKAGLHQQMRDRRSSTGEKKRGRSEPPRLDRTRNYGFIRSSDPPFKGFSQDGHVFDSRGGYLRTESGDHVLAERIKPEPNRKSVIGPKVAEDLSPVLARMATHRKRGTAPRAEALRDTTSFLRREIEALLAPLTPPQNVEALSNVLDEIEGLVTLYRWNTVADKKLPRRAERKAHMERLAGWVNEGHAVMRQNRPYFAGMDGYEILRLAIARSHRWVKHILMLQLNEKVTSSAKLDIHRNWLIQVLAKIFAEHTKTRPTFYRDRLTDAHTGPFFTLVRLILPDSDLSDSAIAKAIERARSRQGTDSKG